MVHFLVTFRGFSFIYISSFSSLHIPLFRKVLFIFMLPPTRYVKWFLTQFLMTLKFSIIVYIYASNRKCHNNNNNNGDDNGLLTHKQTVVQGKGNVYKNKQFQNNKAAVIKFFSYSHYANWVIVDETSVRIHCDEIHRASNLSYKINLRWMQEKCRAMQPA